MKLATDIFWIVLCAVFFAGCLYLAVVDKNLILLAGAVMLAVFLVLATLAALGLFEPRVKEKPGPTMIPIWARLAIVAVAIASIWTSIEFDFSAEWQEKMLGGFGVITLIMIAPTLWGKQALWERR
jgi:hypothetical protein